MICVESSLWNVFVFSSVTSAGLPLAVIVTWVLQYLHFRRKNQTEVRFSPLKKSWLLLLLWVASIVPESFVLAMSFVSAATDLGLAVALFFVSFTDFTHSILETYCSRKPPGHLYPLLFLLAAFALGTLQAVFGTVLDRFEINDKRLSDVATLIFGLILGVASFVGITFARNRYDEKFVHHHEIDQLVALKRLLAEHRRQLYTLQSSETLPHAPADGADDGESQPLRVSSRRVNSLQNLVESLEHARGLRKELSSRHRMTIEVDRAVEDVLEERISAHLQNQPSDPALQTGEQLSMRMIKFLLVSVILAVFMVGITFALIPLFRYLCGDPLMGYAHSAVEGFSGGFFLGKIAGAILPALQSSRFRSNLAIPTQNLMAIISYGLGIIAILLLNLLPPLDIQ